MGEGPLMQTPDPAVPSLPGPHCRGAGQALCCLSAAWPCLSCVQLLRPRIAVSPSACRLPSTGDFGSLAACVAGPSAAAPPRMGAGAGQLAAAGGGGHLPAGQRPAVPLPLAAGGAGSARQEQGQTGVQDSPRRAAALARGAGTMPLGQCCSSLLVVGTRSRQRRRASATQ